MKGFKWPQWQSLKLKQLREFRKNNKDIFGKHEKNINRYVYKAVKRQFKEGARKVNKEAIRAGILDEDSAGLGGSFFGINDRKIKALINSVNNNLKDAKTAALRMSNDVYRSTVYKASQMASSGAKTLNQAIDMATRDFLNRGFNCIEYKDKRRVNIADYSDMAVRTATKRANLIGEGEFRKRLGNPLIYVSKHSTSCEKCSKWQGRVYIDDVWSGGTEQDGKYPLLSTAIEGGLYHNRCEHGQSTYFEGINEEPEEIQEIQENEHIWNDEYTQELRRRQKQYERLAIGSLVPENIEKYQNKAKGLQNQIEDVTISEEEQYAINSYISSESYKINDKLRNNIKLNDLENSIVKDLDVTLNKMQEYRGNVRRSLQLNKEELKGFLEEHKIGSIVNYKAYTSTTAGSRYNDLSNIELYIKSKTGRDLRRFNKEEAEILFKRDTRFKIKSIEKINEVYYIKMEEFDE